MFNKDNCTKVFGNEFLTIYIDNTTGMYYTVDFDGDLVDRGMDYGKIERMFRVFSAIAFSQKALA